jgi:hypothetical protein
LIHFFAGQAQLVLHNQSAAQEDLAHRRQDNASRTTLEQYNTQFPLNLADAAGNGGLGDAQMTGGCPQAPALSDSHNVT